MTTVHDFKVTTIDGKDMPLSQFKDEVLLLVNVASQCGLTPQYAGLQDLHDKYSDQGFKVLGLPCNQFAGQEPGTESEIMAFCKSNYQVTFPLTSKIEVNGDKRHPLYGHLVGESAKFSGDITWNFEKFLIGKEGEVLQRFSPKITPESGEVTSAIEKAIAA